MLVTVETTTTCDGLGRQSPASHGGGPGSIPGQYMWDLRLTTWHRRIECQYRFTNYLYSLINYRWRHVFIINGVINKSLSYVVITVTFVELRVWKSLPSAA
jgi:hypothetical protein